MDAQHSDHRLHPADERVLGLGLYRAGSVELADQAPEARAQREAARLIDCIEALGHARYVGLTAQAAELADRAQSIALGIASDLATTWRELHPAETPDRYPGSSELGSDPDYPGIDAAMFGVTESVVVGRQPSGVTVRRDAAGRLAEYGPAGDRLTTWATADELNVTESELRLLDGNR